MSNTNANNKRILKNTIFLYIRMFLVMGISLYTSRVILRNLGVVDFGIYNVIGGIVSMMAVVNSSMSVATQRYVTFALGEGDLSKTKKVFSSSLLIYLVLSLVLIVLSETFGLWWVNNKLVIPTDRLFAANVIYQFSIVSCIFTLLVNPYNATIIAHEKMDYYAYLSIAEVCMKLGVACVISITMFDHLIMYGALLLVVSFVILLLYIVYCKKKFEECVLQRNQDIGLFKELLSYSGWNMFAAISGVAKSQGINIMLNAFFGPAVNASRGIAYQINAVISQFFINFYTAVKPQVTIYYAKKSTTICIRLCLEVRNCRFILYF